VSGPSGVGKTALVLETLHADFPAQVPATVHVRLAGREVPDLALELLRAIARVDGRETSEWQTTCTDSEAVAATLIELADAKRHWVVIDDAHRASREQLEFVLPLLANYSRASRWVVIGRIEPKMDVELAPQILAVGAMPAEDLRRLATTWVRDVGADEASSWVRDASGSPWRLRRAAYSNGHDGASQAPNGSYAALLEFFAVVRCPLSTALLADLCEDEPTATLRVLEAQGLIEHASSGWRLHEAIVDDMRARHQPSVSRTSDLATILGRASNPLAVLEALRLHLEVNQLAEAALLLGERGPWLVAEGHASELRCALAETEGDAFKRWRAELAVELGDTNVLLELREPKSTQIDDRVTWARVLLARGETTAAARVGEDLRRDFALDTVESFDVDMIVAESHVAAADYRAALALLVAIHPHQADREIHRVELLADTLLGLGELGQARQMARELDRPGVSTRTSALAHRVVAEATWRSGDLRGADTILNRWQAPAAARSCDAVRRLLCTQARIALHRGHLETAETILAGLLPRARGATGSAVEVQLCEAERRLQHGELEPLQRQLGELNAIASRMPPRSDLRVQIQALQVRLDIVTAYLKTGLRTSPLSADSSIAEQRLAVAQIELSLRRGDHADARDDVAGLAGEVPLLLLIVAGLGHLLAGNPGEAIAASDEAVRRSQACGDLLLESEARRSLCDVLIASGDDVRLPEQVRALKELSARFPSRRLALDVLVYELLYRSEPPDPVVVEMLAGSQGCSAMASRRARALLGENVLLDAIDRLVLRDAGRRHGGWKAETMTCTPPDSQPTRTVSWGLNCDRRTVWLDDGREVALQQSPILWRVLTTLARRRGQATKEQLIDEAWDEPYHPLKHDNRLRLAIRKLRKLIEDDPSHPTRLVTVADGYALLGTVRQCGSEAAK
jgi:DNA-binding winged helix-turn-helix (wHTH) protein